jgi:hypothetical protein
MSTLKTTNLQNASASSPAFVLAADGSATANLSSVNGGPIAGSRNRIINGDMRIDQRNAGASVTVNSSNNFYAVDRSFGTGQVTDGVFTVQRSTTAPTGFRNSLIATVTTADASLGATQQYVVGQNIEGFNVADLGWGAAGAQTVTLSFWVRSSLTGTFGGAVVNSGFNRSYPFTYTISAANTFEYKTVTIAGDTSGTWLTDSGVGLRLLFSLGAGSTYIGAAGSWSGSYLAGATGQTQVIGTNGATFYITGVQLEPGSTATPFERRSYGQELSLCQRYYYRIGGNSEVGASAYTLFASGMLWNTGSGDFCVPFKVGMRSAPSITYGGTVAIQYQSTLGNVTSQSTVTGTTKNTAFLRMNTAQSWGAGPGCSLGAANDTTAFLAFNSEL